MRGMWSVGPLRPALSRVNRMTLRGVVALVGLVVALWLDAADPWVLSRTAGAVALLVGLVDLVAELRAGGDRVRLRPLVRGAAWVLLGLVLVGNPVRSVHVLGRLVGFGLLALVAVDVGFGLRRRRMQVGLEERARAPRLLLVQAIAGAVTAGILLAVPAITARLALNLVAATWIVAALIVTVVRPPAPPRFHVSLGDVLAALATWLRDRQMSPVARTRLEDKLFFEGEAAHDRRVRFFGLLLLSVIIATLGVLVDSTAVVVGAMLVAPLMMPMMALTVSLVSGQPERATRAAALVLGGVFLSVATAALLAKTLPVFEGVDTDEQIRSRVSPTVLDLLIALAAGVAGAFSLSREDIADSLPGVAIALALVPPLSVVGVTLQAGAYLDAAGASLLFLTNLVSMLLAGGLTFVALGVVPVDQLYQERDRLRVYASTVVAGMLAVAVPLGIVSRDLTVMATSQTAAESVAERWVERSEGADLLEITVRGDTVAVVAAGDNDPPPVPELAEELARSLGRQVEVEMRWIRELRTVASSD